jgi:hypothetical protein
VLSWKHEVDVVRQVRYAEFRGREQNVARSKQGATDAKICDKNTIYYMLPGDAHVQEFMARVSVHVDPVILRGVNYLAI